jgi:hypothetical protein
MTQATDPLTGEQLSAAGTTAGFWIDILSNCLIDPLTYFGMGPLRGQKQWANLLSTPAGVEKALRKSSVRLQIDDIAQAVRRGDTAAARYRMIGMRPEHQWEILELGPQATFDKVQAVVRRALPGSPGEPGTFLLDFSGHQTLRNDASQLAQLAELGEKHPDIADWVSFSLGGFRRDSRVSVAPGFFFDDSQSMLTQICHRSDDLALHEKYLGWIDDTYRGYLTETKTLPKVGQQALDDALAERLILRKGRPQDVRRFTKAVGYESRLTRPVGSKKTVEAIAADRGKAERIVADLDDQIALLDPTADAAQIATLQGQRDLIASGRWNELKVLRVEKGSIARVRVADRTPEQTARLAEINARLRKLRGMPMMRGVEASQDAIDTLVGRHAQWFEDMAANNRKVEEARRLLNRANRMTDRDTFDHTLARIVDDNGETVLR